MKVSLIFILIYCSSVIAIEPMDYIKKPDITTSTQVVGDKIYFKFGFKDLKGIYQEWSWVDDLNRLVGNVNSFGIYVRDPNKFEYYNSDLPGAMFKNHPEIGVIPDYSRLVSFYYESVTPLYNIWKKSIEKESLNDRQSIELLLRFFQDFPYGVPPDVIGNQFVGGLFVPPLSLQNGWGDCDSKSLLMATVLAHDSSFRNKMAMILVPGHALLGIEFQPQVYDEKYKYRNRTFVVAEPTGLSRTPLGRKNSPYTSLIGVEPIIVTVRESSPTASEAVESKSINELKESDCPDNGLLIDFVSSYEKVRIQQCVIKINDEYVKHGPLVKFNNDGKAIAKEIYNKGSLL